MIDTDFKEMMLTWWTLYLNHMLASFSTELTTILISQFNRQDVCYYGGRTVTMWDAEIILLKVNDSLCVCMCVCVCMVIHVWLFVTPWTLGTQAPLSMEFPRPEDWTGWPCLLQGIKPGLLHLLHWQVHSLDSYKVLLLLPSMLHKYEWSLSFGAQERNRCATSVKKKRDVFQHCHGEVHNTDSTKEIWGSPEEENYKTFSG